MWAYVNEYVRCQRTEFSCAQRRQRMVPFYCFCFCNFFFLFYFIILLFVIIVEASVITEKQSSFSGKIIDGDG